MSKEIYLDNAATTEMDPLVLRAMLPFLKEGYGNASSPHALGQKAKTAIEKARNIIAKSISADPSEIVFTSGGTESNNFAIKGIAFQNKDKGNHIITTKIEHPSVLNVYKWLENQGFKISYIETDKYGFISSKELDKAITKKTILVSIIHGQNEFGTIQDLETLGKVCKKHDVYFHTDACQSYTKTDINVKKQAVDLITLNAHKIHGPKGVGVLYVRKGTRIMTWQHGGGQEIDRRSGTENVAGIVGFGRAVELGLNKNHIKAMRKLKNILIKELIKIPRVKINGPRDERGLPNIVNAVFLGIEGEAIVGLLDMENIYAATGSACSSNKLEPNPALLAIGLMPQEVNGTVRFSLSRFNTEKEIEKLLNKLPGIVEKLRKFSPF
ncbi:MAG: cysteine desulfurase family protein [Candidatus Parcubacteria bacterium]|nr:cysteine desulfurase family protein [Candidatus Parcubacteria bacterium]